MTSSCCFLIQIKLNAIQIKYITFFYFSTVTSAFQQNFIAAVCSSSARTGTQAGSVLNELKSAFDPL